jgi:hypothetical protein
MFIPMGIRSTPPLPKEVKVLLALNDDLLTKSNSEKIDDGNKGIRFSIFRELGLLEAQ